MEEFTLFQGHKLAEKSRVCVFGVRDAADGGDACARLSMVLVHVTGSGDSARVVFDFPKLVGYHILKTDAGFDLVFDTPMARPSPCASRPP